MPAVAWVQPNLVDDALDVFAVLAWSCKPGGLLVEFEVILPGWPSVGQAMNQSCLVSHLEQEPFQAWWCAK